MKKKKLESLKDFSLEVLKSEQTLAITGGDGECSGTRTEYTKELAVFDCDIEFATVTYNDWNDEGCC